LQTTSTVASVNNFRVSVFKYTDPIQYIVLASVQASPTGLALFGFYHYKRCLGWMAGKELRFYKPIEPFNHMENKVNYQQ
jgi:hypothetical protein